MERLVSSLMSVKGGRQSQTRGEQKLFQTLVRNGKLVTLATTFMPDARTDEVTGSGVAVCQEDQGWLPLIHRCGDFRQPSPRTSQSPLNLFFVLASAVSCSTAESPIRVTPLVC